MGDLRPVRGILVALALSLPIDILIAWIIWRAVIR
jgi:hypothetical protein